jgi:hypothetical protein
MFRSLSILLIFLAVSAQAEAASNKWRKVWKASLVVMASASFVDAASSYGRVEINPILASNGRFRRKALALKVSIGAGLAVAEFLLHHKRPESEVEMPAALVNFATAATFSAAAIHNIHNKK